MNASTPLRPFASSLATASVALLSALLLGCTSTTITTQPRTAIEQLLLSTATDEALAGVEVPEVRGETVYVDARYLETYDEPYVIGAIRSLLSQNGALLQESRSDAAVIVEPRSGVLGQDMSSSLFGIPSVPIPIPGTSTVETPELALYSSQKADSVAQIALLAYRQDGSHLFSRGPLLGKSHFHQYRILLLLNVNFTDIQARDDY